MLVIWNYQRHWNDLRFYLNIQCFCFVVFRRVCTSPVKFDGPVKLLFVDWQNFSRVCSKISIDRQHFVRSIKFCWTMFNWIRYKMLLKRKSLHLLITTIDHSNIDRFIVKDAGKCQFFSYLSPVYYKYLNNQSFFCGVLLVWSRKNMILWCHILNHTSLVTILLIRA